MIAHGAEWTVKHGFVYPNEFIYWGMTIVMYPYMTGLVAGAFVLSSLYHVEITNPENFFLCLLRLFVATSKVR